MSNEANDFLDDNGGASYPGVAFPNIGDLIVGDIIEKPRVVETVYDGKPSKSLVVAVTVRAGSTASTGQRGSYVPARVGEEVSIWIKAGAMARAVKDATSKVAGLAVGGTLALKYTQDGDAKPGKNPPKLYAAEYVAPVAAVSLSAIVPNTAGGGGMTASYDMGHVAAAPTAQSLIG